jgi:hypothetical protein
MGALSAGRAHSYSNISTKGPSHTIVVEFTSCTFSMEALNDMIASVDQIKAQAKAMQQQHAEKEEAQERKLELAKIHAAEAWGEYGRLRAHHEETLKAMEQQWQQAQDDLQACMKKFEALR